MKKTLKEIASIFLALFLAVMVMRLVLFIFNVTLWAVFNLVLLIIILIIAAPIYIVVKKMLFK